MPSHPNGGEGFAAWLVRVRSPPVDPVVVGLNRAKTPAEAVCRVASAAGIRCGVPELLLYDCSARAIINLVGHGHGGAGVARASRWCREAALPWMERALAAVRAPPRCHGTRHRAHGLACCANPPSHPPQAWDDTPDPEFARLCLLWFILRCEYAPGNVLNGHATVLCEQAGWVEGYEYLHRFGRPRGESRAMGVKANETREESEPKRAGGTSTGAPQEQPS